MIATPGRWFLAWALVTTVAAPAWAADTLRLEVLPRHSDEDVPVRVELPPAWAKARPAELQVALHRPDANRPAAAGQVTRGPGGARELWWILPTAEANARQEWIATVRPVGGDRPGEAERGIAVRHDSDAQSVTLRRDGQPALRHMSGRDASTPERDHATYKVYTHVFGPGTGQLLTKGPGGLYTHHRGIFLGYNKVRYDGREDDFWHMTRGARQLHREWLVRQGGPALGRIGESIDWVNGDGEVVLTERRWMSLIAQADPNVRLIEVRSELTTQRDRIRLDGDPEHAGLQFRAHNDVDRSKTRYALPEGAGDVREARDLPWAAMQFTLDGATWTVQHMNHPDNPNGARYSAYRDYGRFGAFPAATVTPDRPVVLRYRLRISPGPLPPPEVLQQAWEAFAHPPQVRVRPATENNTDRQTSE